MKKYDENIKISNIIISKKNSEKIDCVGISVSKLFNYFLDNLEIEDINIIKRRFHNDETKNTSRT